MIAQKKTNPIETSIMELLASNGAVERVKRHSLLQRMAFFLFSKKCDLTLEIWRELEAKPKSARAYPAPLRDQYQHFRLRL
jgi:hypothetical protein